VLIGSVSGVNADEVHLSSGSSSNGSLTVLVGSQNRGENLVLGNSCAAFLDLVGTNFFARGAIVLIKLKKSRREKNYVRRSLLPRLRQEKQMFQATNKLPADAM